MTSSDACCGYRRLSVDRAGTKIGYDVQTNPSVLWAARTGQTIAHWYQDKNESAADETLFREQYEQMLADLRAGMYRNLVVWRVDRLTRLDEEFLRVWGIVRRNGGHIYSVDENLSTETDTGLTQMKLKVLLGDSEVRSGKRRIKANVNERLKRGQYMGGGRRPYGFEGPQHDDFGRVVNTGRVGIIHVAHEIANLQEAARRVAWEQESYGEVIADWHDRAEPIMGVTGAPWSIKTLETILTSPRMIAKQEYRDEETGERALADALWLPVLDEKTYKKLVSMKKKATKKYNSRERYLLTNLIKCGRCKLPLQGSQRTYLKDGEPVAVRCYRCPSSTAYKQKGHCGKLNALADDVEKLVVARIFVRLEATRGFMTSLAGVDDQSLDLLDALERKVAEVNEQLVEVEATYTKRRIKLDEYLRLRDPIQAELAEYDEKMRSVSSRLDVPTPVGSDWSDLPRWFEGLSLRQQKVVVEAHIRHAEVAVVERSGRYFRPERVVVEPFDVPLSDLELSDAEGE